MPLRMIEIFLPTEKEKQVHDMLDEFVSTDVWSDRISESRTLVRVLLPTEETEAVLDALDKRFSYLDDFRIILLPVKAAIPRCGEAAKETPENPECEEELKQPPRKLSRISREELYTNITEMARLTNIYIIFVILSSIVAAIGIMRSNVAIIVGAMVIAPLLGPNVALSFGTTLGDSKLIRNALKSNMAGIAVALALSIAGGIVLGIDTSSGEVVSRTQASLYDIVLALAAGSAGALSLTAGLSSALIGVMVAVALLPPLVTFGMLVGAGDWRLAFGAMLILFVNLICINLAGVVTFLLHGIRPLTWWESDRARKATRLAIVLWSLLLITLIVLIILSQQPW